MWRGLDLQKAPEEYEFRCYLVSTHHLSFPCSLWGITPSILRSTELAAETVLKSTYVNCVYERRNWTLQKNYHNYGMGCNSYSKRKEGFIPSIETLSVSWQTAEDAFTFKDRPPDDYFSFTNWNFLFLKIVIVESSAFRSRIWYGQRRRFYWSRQRVARAGYETRQLRLAMQYIKQWHFNPNLAPHVGEVYKVYFLWIKILFQRDWRLCTSNRFQSRRNRTKHKLKNSTTTATIKILDPLLSKAYRGNLRKGLIICIV